MNSGADHTANYQALAIITRLLMAGIFLITTVAIALHYIEGGFIKDESLTSNYVLGILSLVHVSVVGARLIYNRRINTLKEFNQTSKEKPDIFRAITITHKTLCEIPALLGIISFMIPGTFLVSCSGGNGFNRNGLEISFSIENRTHYKTRNVLKF